MSGDLGSARPPAGHVPHKICTAVIAAQREAPNCRAHVAEIALANVSFKIREVRRQAVIANRCHEVHARDVRAIVAATPVTGTVISYNLYKAATYSTRADNTPVASDFFHFTSANGAVGSRKNLASAGMQAAR